MLGIIFNGADWAMRADAIVIWIFCGLAFINYWKELREAEK